MLALGWEPLHENRPLAKNDGKLMGQYLLKCCKANGTLIKDLPAATEWVETHFKKPVLVAAQKAFVQTLTKQTVQALDNEQHCLLL